MPSIFLYLAFLASVLIGFTVGQDDFSGPIECYHCLGDAYNSSCADPIDIRRKPLPSKECIYGVCLKWTHYIKGVLHMHRICSSDIDVNIMLVDGVCRTESFGNGYLCMCGRHLCNGGNSNKIHSWSNMAMILLCTSLSAIILNKYS